MWKGPNVNNDWSASFFDSGLGAETFDQMLVKIYLAGVVVERLAALLGVQTIARSNSSIPGPAGGTVRNPKMSLLVHWVLG